MPRRNHPRNGRRARSLGELEQKPRGKKRPRRFHRGREQDRLYGEALRRLDEAA